MPAFLLPLASFLSTAFAFLVKHPIVLKMMFFTIFTGIISFFLTFFFDMVRPYVVSSPFLTIAYQLGLIQALSLFLTILIAGFGAKQVLAFIRS